MNDNQPPINWFDRAAGLGAALASALLFAASTRQSGPAMVLAYLSPLPLMIGVIGFSALGAFLGVLFGAFLLSYLVNPAFGLAFLLGFGAPGLLVGGLTIAVMPPAKGESAPLPRFFGPGALLAVIVCLAVAAAWLAVGGVINHYHGFNEAMSALLRRFGPALDKVVGDLKKMSPGIDADEAKRLIILSAPAGVALSQTLLLSVNLWLAARTAEISGRFGRRWPDLPEHLVLPRLIAPAFVVALGLTFDGGLVGALAGALAAAAGLALAIQGLAAIHGLSRPAAFRSALLAAVYAAVFVLQPWSIVILAIWGVVESVFSLRARKARSLSNEL